MHTLNLIYGAPPAMLYPTTDAQQQCSYRCVGSRVLDEVADASAAHAVALLPAGTLERRYIAAQLLRVLAAGAPFIALAPKDKGGLRIKRELEALGCKVREDSRAHHRICYTVRPAVLKGVQEAMAHGALQHVNAHGLFTQPGIFSWDRIDDGTALLLENLPVLAGKGADFGCGYGLLSWRMLQQETITHLDALDSDWRAVNATKHNIPDARLHAQWCDITRGTNANECYDFVVMNPPFHDGSQEDASLGQQFITRAAQQLRAGGMCLIVANNHLPYEAVLQAQFTHWRCLKTAQGFKVLEAIK